jgi:hypothetical protein
MPDFWTHFRNFRNLIGDRFCVPREQEGQQELQQQSQEQQLRQSTTTKTWIQRLRNASQREIKMTTNPSGVDYEQMKDPLHTKPDYRKQPSSSMEMGHDELLDDDEEEAYLVRQSHGYCAILFSLAQTVILIIMMVKCGVAPININPMVGPYPGEHKQTFERRQNNSCCTESTCIRMYEITRNLQC